MEESTGDLRIIGDIPVFPAEFDRQKRKPTPDSSGFDSGMETARSLAGDLLIGVIRTRPSNSLLTRLPT